MICLFKDYGKYVNKGIHVIWFLLIAVGFGSVYFHATLSMVGQLMDEIFILWVLIFIFVTIFCFLIHIEY
jgi:alkaline ceramidase